MMTEQNSPKDLNSLNSLSETWHEIRLMDHFSIATGNTPPSSHKDSYGGEFLFAGPGDLGKQKYIYDTEKKINSSALKYIRKFPKGSTLFTCIGSTIGKTGLAVQEMTSNQQINAVFPNHQDNCEFIYYALTYRAPIIKLNAGHQAVPIINKNEFGQTLIKVPKSASEQIKIATALSDTDALISELEKLIEKKQAIKTATMQQLLTGKTRLPEFALREDGTPKDHKDSELGQIPEDWEVVPFRECIDIPQGQVNPINEPYASMILVGPKHIESGTGKLLFEETASEQQAISGKYLFEEGDVLYGKINPYLMKATLVDFKGLCSADMYPLRPKDNIKPGLLLALILGEDFTKYAVSVSARSGMPKINRNELAQYKFCLPNNLEEQEKIANILLSLDESLESLNIHLNKIYDIKKGMMQELLTGKTRLV